MKRKFFLHALVFLMVALCASASFATDFTELTGTWRVVSSVRHQGTENPLSVGSISKVDVTQSGSSYVVTVSDDTGIETNVFTPSNGNFVHEGYDGKDEIIYTDTDPDKIIYNYYGIGTSGGFELYMTITYERVSSSNTHESEGHADFTEITGTWKVISVNNPGNESIPSEGDTVKVNVIQSGTSYTVSTDIDDEIRNYTVQDGKLVSEVYYSPSILDIDEITYTAPNKITITCHVNGALNYTVICERVSSDTTNNGQGNTSTQTSFTGMAETWKVVSTDRYHGDGTLPPVGATYAIKVTQSGTSYDVTISGDTETYGVKDGILVHEDYNSGKVMGRDEIIYTAPNKMTYSYYESDTQSLVLHSTVISERVIASTEAEAPTQTVQTKIEGNKAEVVKAIEENFEDLPENVEIKTFSASSNTYEGENKTFTSSELSEIISSTDENATTANPVILETMSVNEPGIYTFVVPKDKLTAKAKIFIYMIYDDLLGSVSLGSLKVAAEKAAKTAVFVDDEGNPIETVPDSGNVNVAAYMEKDTAYTPVVTQAADTTTTPNNETPKDDDNDSPSSSGSGCDVSGIGIFALAVLTLLKKRGKK